MDIIEPFAVPDIFVSGLGEVEHLGEDCWRFTFYAKQQVGGETAYVAVAKLVGTRPAVMQAIQTAAKGIGVCACEQAPEMRVN